MNAILGMADLLSETELSADQRRCLDAVIGNGTALLVSDVGNAISAPQDSRQAAWADGKRGIFLVIFKQPGANVIATVDKIMAALPKLTLAMPPSARANSSTP